jgi:hypothetical protein
MYFVWISEQTAIISLYNINWLVLITETECVYCAVWNVWISEPTAIISLYSINWLALITEAVISADGGNIWNVSKAPLQLIRLAITCARNAEQDLQLSQPQLATVFC